MIDQEKAVKDWVDVENSQWAVVTLRCNQIGSLTKWDSVVSVALNEVSNTYPKPNEKKRRRAAGIHKIRCITMIGGDKSAGILYHAHGLVEVINDDIDRLEKCLRKAWFHSVGTELGRGTPRFAAFSRQFQSAVYVRPYINSEEDYLGYMMRGEGSELGKKLNKVIFQATRL
jgi:hypothetical protein